MKIQDKITILQYFLNIFNGLFLVIGFVILGCGIWILFDTNSFITALFPSDEDEHLTVIGKGLMAIGCFTAVVCLLGCVGSLKEVRFLLWLYVAFLVLIFICQLVASLAALVSQSKILDKVDKKVSKMIEKYKDVNETSDSGWMLLNVIQDSFNCCGYTNYTNWLSSDGANDTSLTLPCSCAKDAIETSETFCNIAVSEMEGKQGCKDEILNWLSMNILVIAGVGLVLIIMEVFQFSLALSLLRSIQRLMRVDQI